MSYYSDVTGEMTFSRPLKQSEARASELVAALEDDWSIWKLTEAVSEEVDSEDDTTIIRRRFTGLELRWGDEIKAIGYGWASVLERIIRALPEDVTVSGMFEAEGERDGSGYTAERLYVVGRDVATITPTVTWPETPEGAVA